MQTDVRVRSSTGQHILECAIQNPVLRPMKTVETSFQDQVIETLENGLTGQAQNRRVLQQISGRHWVLPMSAQPLKTSAAFISDSACRKRTSTACASSSCGNSVSHEGSATQRRLGRRIAGSPKICRGNSYDSRLSRTNEFHEQPNSSPSPVKPSPGAE